MLSNGELITLSSAMCQTMNTMLRFSNLKLEILYSYANLNLNKKSLLHKIMLFFILSRLEMALKITKHGVDQKI